MHCTLIDRIDIAAQGPRKLNKSVVFTAAACSAK